MILKGKKGKGEKGKRGKGKKGKKGKRRNGEKYKSAMGDKISREKGKIAKVDMVNQFQDALPIIKCRGFSSFLVHSEPCGGHNSQQNLLRNIYFC